MKEVHTEVPYSKRCEFCTTRHSVATLHADNQVVPTFSVTVCAECLDKLVYGHMLSDIFGWSWRIDGVNHRITAIMSPTGTLGWESNEHPTPTQETRDLVQDLARAIQDYHLGLHTTRPFTQTYGRDETLLFRATNWLGEFTEKGVPDGDH